MKTKLIFINISDFCIDLITLKNNSLIFSALTSNFFTVSDQIKISYFI